MPYDRDGAKTVLDEIAQSFGTYNADDDRFFRSGDIAAWASAYRSIDAAQARWQLEREWARQTNRIQLTPSEESLRSRQMQSLILAMAALDVERAKAMIFTLPVDQERRRALYRRARAVAMDAGQRRRTPTARVSLYLMEQTQEWTTSSLGMNEQNLFSEKKYFRVQ